MSKISLTLSTRVMLNTPIRSMVHIKTLILVTINPPLKFITLIKHKSSCQINQLTQHTHHAVPPITLIISISSKANHFQHARIPAQPFCQKHPSQQFAEFAQNNHYDSPPSWISCEIFKQKIIYQQFITQNKKKLFFSNLWFKIE